MTDALILALILSGMLTLLGYKLRSRPVSIVAGFGWVISSFYAYDELSSLLCMALLLMIAITQVFLVRD